MEGIAGKVHVVTGAAGGIGAALSSVLSRHGAKVVMADTNEAYGGPLAARIAAKTGNAVHFRAADVADTASVDALASWVEQEVGPAYGLVANAGVVSMAPAFEFTDEAWRRIMAVNVDGVFHCCRAFGNAMRGRGGSMVLISSIAATVVVRPERTVAYGASKAAVAHMAALLGVEWAREGIRVNSLAPGYTETPMTRKTRADDPHFYDRWMDDTPLGRFIQPEEIANAAMFLLSDLASAVTAAHLPVDGGYAKA